MDDRVVRGMEEVFGMFDDVASSDHRWNDRLRVLEICISRLSKKLRIAIELTYKSGKSLQEAAASLNTTQAAVGQRLSRARKFIRNCVLQQTSDDN